MGLLWPQQSTALTACQRKNIPFCSAAAGRTSVFRKARLSIVSFYCTVTPCSELLLCYIPDNLHAYEVITKQNRTLEYTRNNLAASRKKQERQCELYSSPGSSSIGVCWTTTTKIHNYKQWNDTHLIMQCEMKCNCRKRYQWILVFESLVNDIKLAMQLRYLLYNPYLLIIYVYMYFDFILVQSSFSRNLVRAATVITPVKGACSVLFCSVPLPLIFTVYL